MDEDDEFGKAIANGVPPDADAPGEHDDTADQQKSTAEANDANTDANAASQQPDSHGAELPNGTSQPPLANGMPHAEELEPHAQNQDFSQQTPQSDSNVGADNTFLSASIDGTIRVWDRRQPDAVARITSRNAPPWCMNACWSPDGNYIYAGRRNGTVEEFSLHKGLREAERVFKFPQGSGPVTAVRAMPNGRHIVWCVFSFLFFIPSQSIILFHTNYNSQCLP